jgi:Fe-S oxidoreductase
VWAARARKLAERVTAFTPFVASVFRERPVRGRRLGLRATYHDACQSANVLGVHQDPRTLLREIAGVEIVEMAESSVCCGFGGSFSFEYPEVANRVLERKLANIDAAAVDCVIADNPGCLTHLRGAMDAREKTTQVRHIAEVLWESLSSGS